MRNVGVPVLLGAILLAAPAARGDGFHSPLLRNPDPHRWAITLREKLGLDRSDTAARGEPMPGFSRRATAGKLLDVLKYLDRKNVLLREFPDFNYDDIPAFKSETEALLIAIGKDAVPLLVNTLAADVREEAGAARLKLARDFLDRVVRILIAIGEDSLPEVMARLPRAEGRFASLLLRVLRGIVKDPDFGRRVDLWQRWYRIRSAGKSGDLTAVPMLLAALSDADRRFRLAAARALGRLGRKEAVPYLLDALSGSTGEATVRAILRALGRIGDPRAVPALIGKLEAGNAAVRGEAATALRFLTHRMFGFDPQAPADERKLAVARWRKWWSSRPRK